MTKSIAQSLYKISWNFRCCFNEDFELMTKILQDTFWKMYWSWKSEESIVVHARQAWIWHWHIEISNMHCSYWTLYKKQWRGWETWYKTYMVDIFAPSPRFGWWWIPKELSGIPPRWCFWMLPVAQDVRRRRKVQGMTILLMKVSRAWSRINIRSCY